MTVLLAIGTGVIIGLVLCLAIVGLGEGLLRVGQAMIDWADRH